MKAIVLTFDRHRAITQHLMLQYQRLWPDHPFRFRIPYQQLRGPDLERAEYIESPLEIPATVLRLIEDIEDEEWVYWCSDDKYPIRLIVEKVKELLNYALTASEISGLLFCRTRVTLDRPELALHPNQRVTPSGDILLERKAWYQIWIHQFLRAKVLRFLFSQLPAQVPSAKASGRDSLAKIAQPLVWSQHVKRCLPRWDPLNGAGAARRGLALPMRWRQNFTGRATLCGAGLKLALSPRLNFETIFGHFLPAMNLISSARDHRVILACVI